MLKVRFALDDDHLEALKGEVIEAKQLAVDEHGKVLVWTGSTASPPPPAPASERAPRTYTPPYLVEKILSSHSALADERKQVTVLFADLKDSTELIRDLAPEAAQQLLDPATQLMMDAVHRFEGTVNLELRATLGLSRLWQRQGQQDEACELLAAVYDHFTKGFDTADLREAKALLAALV